MLSASNALPLVVLSETCVIAVACINNALPLVVLSSRLVWLLLSAFNALHCSSHRLISADQHTTAATMHSLSSQGPRPTHAPHATVHSLSSQGHACTVCTAHRSGHCHFYNRCHCFPIVFPTRSGWRSWVTGQLHECVQLRHLPPGPLSLLKRTPAIKY